MDELRRLLQEGDPLRHEPGLHANDVERMRRAIAGAAAEGPDRSWHGGLVVTAAAAVLVSGIVAAERVILRHTTVPAPTHQASGVTSTSRPDPRDVRQLQFVTQNGTRVIWTFDSEFDVRAQR